MEKVISLIEEAKRSLYRKVQEDFIRKDKFIYLHELLYCTRKKEFEKEYGELIEPETVNEIVDGFLTEEFIARFGQKTLEHNYLYVSNKRIEGKRVATHVDIWAKDFAMELKTPTFVFPKGELPPEKEYYIEEEAKMFSIPENYELQAKAQKYLLGEKYPELKYYLVLKTTTKVFSPSLFRVRMKKVWIIKEIEPMSDEEWNELVEDYLIRKEKGKPKWEWECKYCSYREYGICEGEKKEVQIDNEEITRLYVEYQKKKEELSNVERELRLRLKGKSIEINGKEIGYIEKESIKWNLEKLKEVCEKDDLCRFVIINWRKNKEIEKILKEKGLNPEEFKTVEKSKVFKI